MDEQAVAVVHEPGVYEPPVLVELGEFTADTLGRFGYQQDCYEGVCGETG